MSRGSGGYAGAQPPRERRAYFELERLIQGALDRLAEITGTESPVDHGALVGLGDDDHTQYALADGTRGLFDASGAAAAAQSAAEAYATAQDVVTLASANSYTDGEVGDEETARIAADNDLQTNIDAEASARAAAITAHHDAASTDHDDRYYTESESDSRFVWTSGDTISGPLTLTSQLNLNDSILRGANLYTQKLLANHTTDRYYIAPNNPNTDAYLWGEEFGYDWSAARWYFDTPLTVGTPTALTDATTKTYVDDAVAAVSASLTDHINDATDAHDSSAITYDGSGNSAIVQAWLTATDLQTAVGQLAGQLYTPDEETMEALIAALNALVIADPDADGITNPDLFSSDLIVARHLAAGSVVAGKIDAQAVTTAALATDAVTADKILAGTITAEKLTITPGGDNLVLNSGAEGGDVNVPGLYFFSTMSSSTDDSKSGDRSWKMVTSGGVTDPSGAFWSGDKLLPAGTEYVIGCWVKAPLGTNFSVGHRYLEDDGVTYLGEASTAFVGTGDWQFCTRPVGGYVGATTPYTPCVQVYVAAADNDGRVLYVDEVQIEVGDVLSGYKPNVSEILPGAVGTTTIADGAITTDKLTANAVTTAKLATDAVQSLNYDTTLHSGSDGAITAASYTFTSAGASFTDAAVGGPITIVGAGSGGADLVTTVSVVDSATQLATTAPALTTVSGADYTISPPNNWTVAGSFLDLSAGDFSTPGLSIDGSTGNLFVKGDIEADSFTMIQDGDIAGQLSSTTIGAFPADGLTLVHRDEPGVPFAELKWSNTGELIEFGYSAQAWQYLAPTYLSSEIVGEIAAGTYDEHVLVSQTQNTWSVSTGRLTSGSGSTFVGNGSISLYSDAGLVGDSSDVATVQISGQDIILTEFFGGEDGIRFEGNPVTTGLSTFEGNISANSSGTAALPAIYFGTDNDTGFFRPSANVIGFATSGVERARFTGTDLQFPAAIGSKLQLYGSSTSFEIGVESGGIFVVGSTHCSVGHNSQRVRIGQWTGSSSWRQALEGDHAYILLGASSGSNAYFRTKTTSDSLYLGTGGANKLYIRGSDGLVTVTNYIQDLNQPATGSTSGFQYTMRSTATGILHRFTSKREIKENIKPIKAKLAGKYIDELRPVTFVEKPKPEDDEEVRAWRAADLQHGFIAEEVFEVADGHLATYEIEDGEIVPNGWNMHAMVALLVAEVQELRQRVDKLEKRRWAR